MSRPVLAGYPASSADEAVTPDGRLRADYAALGPALERLGVDGLLAMATGHPSYGDAPALVADLVRQAQEAHGGALADDVAIVVLEHHP